MLDPATESTYGTTNWAAMTVVEMWQSIENQDTTAHWQVVTGWKKSYELTLQHLDEVRNYRENLAAAWPPEKSQASAAYLARLDHLIAFLQVTYDAATANYGALSGATSAIYTSRLEMKRIYDAYVANEVRLADFKLKSSRPVGGKALAPPAKPPISAAQQEQLTNQARTLMAGLSSEITQAHAALTIPPEYHPIDSRNADEKRRQGNGYTAPPIPAAVIPHSDSGSAHAQAHTSKAYGASPATFPSTTAPQEGHSPGLVLGGISPGHSGAPPPFTGPADKVPVGNSPLPGVNGNRFPIESAPPTASWLPMPVSQATEDFHGHANIPRGPSLDQISGGVTRHQAFPPGASGVIGALPRHGTSQPSAFAGSARRINPAGGIIKPTTESTSVGGLTNGVSPHGRRRDAPHSSQRPEADNPWEAAEGVPPVVVPQNVQRIESGPAIGIQ